MKKKYYLFKFNMKFLNIFSIILLILSVGLFYLLYGNNSLMAVGMVGNSFMFLYIPYLIFHELLHSLSYVLFGANFKNITYGAHVEKGVLCCLCKQNITKKNILNSLLCPFIVIGIITLIVGIVVNNPLLILLSLSNISGCSGDLVMFYHLSRLNNYEYSEFDDPTAFAIYTKEDLSNKKMFGLEYIDKKDKLVRKDLKKITVSKQSIIILIAFYVLTILAVCL